MNLNSYDKQLADVRLANLRAILEQRNLTQAEFADMVGLSAGAVSQYTTLRAPVGRSFCRKVETALGLPEGAMDHVNMKVPVEPIPAMLPSTSHAGLSPLHLAVIDVFSKAAIRGVIKDAYCLELMQNLISMQAPTDAGQAVSPGG